MILPKIKWLGSIEEQTFAREQKADKDIEFLERTFNLWDAHKLKEQEAEQCKKS